MPRSIVYQGKYSSTTVNINVSRTLCVIHKLKKRGHVNVVGAWKKQAEKIARNVKKKVYCKRCTVSG